MLASPDKISTEDGLKMSGNLDYLSHGCLGISGWCWPCAANVRASAELSVFFFPLKSGTETSRSLPMLNVPQQPSFNYPSINLLAHPIIHVSMYPYTETCARRDKLN